MLSLSKKYKECIAAVFMCLGVLNSAHAQQTNGAAVSREMIRLTEPGQPMLALQAQRPQTGSSVLPITGDAIYVHGATFGADLSVYYRFDGRSWADAMNDIGLAVWGFDFAGYGASERYPADSKQPVGRMDDVIPQLHRVVAAVRARNGDRPIALVAHSWGAAVAARYAGMYPQDVKALVLFAPIVMRTPVASPAVAGVAPPPSPSQYPLTLWAQYRRFIEDVPRGQPQVLSEAHFQDWGAAYLASDPSAGQRMPPSVMTPYGPIADFGALWSGKALYDPSRIVAPTLLVRGEWDALCNAADASRILQALGSQDKTGINIDRATHLMHLEAQRTALYASVNTFLARTMK